MWIDLSEWTEDLKIFVFHVNDHHKVGLQEDFSKSIGGPILWLLVSLFTQPATCQWPMKNGSGGRDRIHS